MNVHSEFFCYGFESWLTSGWAERWKSVCCHPEGEETLAEGSWEDGLQWCGVARSQHLAVVPLNSKLNLCFVRKDVRGLGKGKVAPPNPVTFQVPILASVWIFHTERELYLYSAALGRPVDRYIWSMAFPQKKIPNGENGIRMFNQNLFQWILIDLLRFYNSKPEGWRRGRSGERRLPPSLMTRCQLLGPTW